MVGGPRKSRIALIQPYWEFFADAVPEDLRKEQESLLDQVVALIDGVEVCARETLDGSGCGPEAAERIAAAEPDAALVVIGMAAPPTFSLGVIESLGRLPLVLLAVSRRSSYGAGYSHSDVTGDGGTVGTSQLASSLHRRRRPHAVLAISLEDDRAGAEVSRTMRQAAAAGRIQKARIGRVGRPIDGYDCVECDADDLRRALGAELVDISPDQVRSAFLDADAAGVAAVAGEVASGFEPAPGLEGQPGFERSLRAAAALRSIDARFELDAGAMNCHVDEIRFTGGIGGLGLAPCFALGRETTAGTPWSCAGDVPTAVAMLATTLLGGGAFYHEIEALDRVTDEALLANSGEHDLALANPRHRPGLVRNRWWQVDPCPGICARFSPSPGPATLVGFTPHPDSRGGFRFVVAEGSFTGRAAPETGTPNAGFRFAGDDGVVAAWTRWVESGVNHHGVASPGHLGTDVAAVAGHLGIDCVWISSAAALST